MDNEAPSDNRLCGCGCGESVQPKRTYAQGHHARVAQRGPGGRIGASFERQPCACGCGTAVNTIYARYLKGHEPGGPGARVAARAAQATAEQLAFGTFIRAAAATANLHGRDLEAALMVAYHAESGHTARARTIAKLAGLLGLSVDEVLSHAPRSSSELGQIVNRGLARSGLTMRDVAKQTGINAQQVQQWISGRRRPTVANLEALANLLGEPDLVTLLSPYTPIGKVKTTCSSCGRERQLWPHQVADLCKACAGRETGLAKIERIRKRRGRAGLIELGQGLVSGRQRWREGNPEQEATILAKLQAGARAYTKTSLELARESLGKLTLNPRGRFGLCRLCGLLVFAKAKDIARAAAEGRPSFGNFHGDCSTTWSRSPEMRAWASQNRHRRPGDDPPAPMPMPPRAAARVSTEAELAEAYVAAVRYFRQREGSKRADRDELGIPRSMIWLARDLGINRPALYKRVERFLSLLPDEATATGLVKTWSSIFLRLRAAEMGITENGIQVAHPDPENTLQVARS